MDMDQLISQITQSTGVSSDLAKQGVQMVGGFLKGKLPTTAGGQIDTLIGGQTISTPQLAQATTLDQIAGAVSQYTKLPESAAKTIVLMAGRFLADHIPAPFGDQVKSLLGITEEHGGIFEQAKDMLGGIFGHKDQ
jgi:hypothetical protein